MKHHHNLRLKILILSMTGPLLIFTCLAIGLISYLVYNLDDGASRSAPDSKTVRIRTIPSLNPVSPASVRTEPELHMAEVADDDNSGPPALTEAPLLPAAPTESVGDADVQIGPMPAVAARVELEAVPTESAVPESVLSDPIVGEAGTTVGPQNEMSPPVERVPQIEIPTEPVSPGPQPETAAAPLPLPQNEPPAPVVPSEPTFVPDSSFFDQLLDQVD